MEKHKSEKKRQVRVGEIDLDTVGAAFLLNVNRKNEVLVVHDEAAPEDIVNPRVICIKVGGSGQVKLNNWDNHGTDLPIATLQVWERNKRKPKYCLFHYQVCSRTCFCSDNEELIFFSAAGPENVIVEEGGEARLRGALGPRGVVHMRLKSGGCLSYIQKIVSYINLLNTKEGLQSLPGYGKKELFPSLSDIFAGMLLIERDPVKQLHGGIEILKAVVDSEQNPFGQIEGFDFYAEAKAENDRQIAKAV